MTPVRLLSRAEREFHEALDFYTRTRGAAAATRFMDDFDAAVARIAADPASLPLFLAAADPELRRCRVGARWPYDVLFKSEPGEAVVHHVWHHHRDPAGI